MESKLARARDLLPSIIITVLSMIQALALELYWTKVQDSDYLWQGGWPAAIGWLQLSVMLLGILQIWLMYVSLMLRFSWLPTMQDTVIPFAIGLLEFSLIDLMGPASLTTWFLVLAATFGLSVMAAHAAHRRARQDPENDYFFTGVPPTSWRDYGATALTIAVLLLVALALWLSGHNLLVALPGLVFAAVALSYQLMLSRRYWLRSLIDPGPDDGDLPG